MVQRLRRRQSLLGVVLEESREEVVPFFPQGREAAVGRRGRCRRVRVDGAVVPLFQMALRGRRGPVV